MSDSLRILTLSILQLISVLGFAILLLTFLLASSVSRSRPWVGFSVGWIIACLSYDVLFLAGQQHDPTPDRAICLVQAALVQSVPVLQATTNLSLIVDIWLLVGEFLQPSGISKRQLLTYRVSVVLLPHVFSACVFVGYILFGVYNPSTVQKPSYSAYCTIVYPSAPSAISTGLFGFFMLFAILFKLLFGWLLYQRWDYISNFRKCVTMIIRIMIFTTANGVVLILNVLLHVGIIEQPTVDITNAAFPLLIFTLMATEQDLLETWIFWRWGEFRDLQLFRPPKALMSEASAILAFSILQVIGAAGFLLILLTVAFSSRVKRRPAWIGFCVGWLLACVSFALLFISGRYRPGPPHRILCLVQAALVHSVPVLQAGTNLSLVVDTWHRIRKIISKEKEGLKYPWTFHIALVISPFAFFVCIFIGYLVSGICFPKTVGLSPSDAYCRIHGLPPTIISVGLFCLFLLHSIIFKFLLGSLLYKHWVFIGNDAIKIVRMIVVTTIVGSMVLITALHMAHTIKRVVADLVLATFPIFTLAFFMAERDILEAWFPFVRRDTSFPTVEPSA
ncbi:Fungal pheromone STE3G-protein-coupled receptor [Pleurotus pulmonarius]